MRTIHNEVHDLVFDARTKDFGLRSLHVLKNEDMTSFRLRPAVKLFVLRSWGHDFNHTSLFVLSDDDATLRQSRWNLGLYSEFR